MDTEAPTVEALEEGREHAPSPGDEADQSRPEINIAEHGHVDDPVASEIASSSNAKNGYAEGAGPSSDMRVSGSQPSQEDTTYTDIQVQPAESHGSGPNFYNITGKNNEGQTVSARRRFDDLVQLHEDLKRRFRGCVIPFRPGKTKTNSTVLLSHGDSFLRERAFAIKCYLNKVVQHPEMKHSEMLRQFMESSEVLRQSSDWSKEQLKQPGIVAGLFTSVKKLAGAVPRLPTPSQVMQGSGKSEHDLVRQMAEMRVSRRALHDHADAAERALLDMGDQVADMLRANQSMAGSAMTLVDTARKLLDTHADNGQGLHSLTNFERESGLAAELKLSTGAVDVMTAGVESLARTCGDAMQSALMRQMAIMEPIHDHAHTLPRVEKALAARLDALVVLESLRRQEGIINASYQQLLAKELSGSMRNADVVKMNRIREEVDQVQQAKAAGEKSYDLLKQRNERDITLYRTDRSMAFCFMVMKLAEAQAALQSALADIWEGMAAKSGADIDSYGPNGVQDLAYADLGKQVSHSAVLIEHGLDDSVASVPIEGPVPTEHEGVSTVAE